jgi:hypothetical protein
MKNKLALVVGASVLTLLGACGGGSDADAVDKYVGNWRGCTNHSDGSSYLFTFSLTKKTATTGAFNGADSSYTTPDCAGNLDSNETYAGTFTIDGTKTIAGKVADKFTMTTAEGSDKQVFYVGNSLLYIGVSDEDGGTRDSEGYPNTLEATGTAKQ